MNKLISKQVIGALALLCSSVSMAATINVVSTNNNPNVGQTFSVTVSGAGFPETAGATLQLSWNTAAVSVTSVVLATGSPFPTIVAASPFNLVTVLGPLSGTQPSGSFNAFTVNFTAIGTGGGNPPTAPANILLTDDQGDFCWTDANTNACVPVQYTQANVTVHAPVVPVPAAAWLLMSGLGSLVGIKRLRRQS